VDGDRNETETERYDRNMNELLQELRVALPGVQVLFAFLLTVPFAQRFGDVTPFQKNVYFATLLCSALASALFIAPTAYHRLNFRRQDKRHIVETASRFAILGLIALALAVVGAVITITDFLFGDSTVLITGAGVALLFVVLWFAMPLLRRRRNAIEAQASEQRADARPRSTRPAAG
jgi:small-conductance mechanosensitive channel